MYSTFKDRIAWVGLLSHEKHEKQALKHHTVMADIGTTSSLGRYRVLLENEISLSINFISGVKKVLQFFLPLNLQTALFEQPPSKAVTYQEVRNIQNAGV